MYMRRHTCWLDVRTRTKSSWMCTKGEYLGFEHDIVPALSIASHLLPERQLTLLSMSWTQRGRRNTGTCSSNVVFNTIPSHPPSAATILCTVFRTPLKSHWCPRMHAQQVQIHCQWSEHDVQTTCLFFALTGSGSSMRSRLESGCFYTFSLCLLTHGRRVSALSLPPSCSVICWASAVSRCFTDARTCGVWSTPNGSSDLSADRKVLRCWTRKARWSAICELPVLFPS
ncbi:uncharacterized protein B0H18DRAFT_978449 [Fomitopsis serialis]|uniref:uncharacterized protein n=1 Tax=Fomitopsis serialis TaxID=139415 RepID=UPI00200801B1|nr:uncharacterized protein B0H18DRAFT_978449 [Neoantrodia serialis]KAH9934823.1 hypothetical protein B0H18DRAFT_978449 [Neoantrodia serialis]